MNIQEIKIMVLIVAILIYIIGVISFYKVLKDIHKREGQIWRNRDVLMSLLISIFFWHILLLASKILEWLDKPSKI